MIVEDEILIGLDLGQFLEESGFDVVGPCISVSAAIEQLRGPEKCHAAVLDINLGKESAEPVALALLKAGIPFVVVSGYGAGQKPPVYDGAPSLHKPLNLDDLGAALRNLLQPA